MDGKEDPEKARVLGEREKRWWEEGPVGAKYESEEDGHCRAYSAFPKYSSEPCGSGLMEEGFSGDLDARVNRKGDR